MEDSKDFTVSQHIGGALIFAECMEECFHKEPIINILQEAELKADQLQAQHKQLQDKYELDVSLLNAEKAQLTESADLMVQHAEIQYKKLYEAFEELGKEFINACAVGDIQSGYAINIVDKLRAGLTINEKGE